MTAVIKKWGNSQGIRLPKHVLEDLSLKENDKVEISVENESIVISKPARRRRGRKSLDERFGSYAGEYKCSEYDWGAPTGEEYW